MQRILICYLVENSGHHSAARALAAVFQEMAPGAQVLTVNLLEYTNPKWEKIIRQTYLGAIHRTPELWDTLYDSALIERFTRRIRHLVQRGTGRALLNLMHEFSPDAAICTQAHPLAVLAAYAARYQPDLPLWGVVTDFVPHRFWVVNNHSRVRYVVPNEAGADRLMWLGIDRQRVSVHGIPVLLSTHRETAPRPTPPEAPPRVLVMGGSRGIGVRYKTVYNLDQSAAPFTIDVICGTNLRLRRKLAKTRHLFRHRLRVRGYVRAPVLLMRRSSVLITKPGGLTSAEAMAVGLPMVLVRPLPGQERKNTDVMVREGTALHLQSDRDVAPIVTTLLQHAELLTTMRRRALAFGRPNAARAIAAEVLAALNAAP